MHLKPTNHGLHPGDRRGNTIIPILAVVILNGTINLLIHRPYHHRLTTFHETLSLNHRTALSTAKILTFPVTQMAEGGQTIRGNRVRRMSPGRSYTDKSIDVEKVTPTSKIAVILQTTEMTDTEKTTRVGYGKVIETVTTNIVRPREGIIDTRGAEARMTVAGGSGIMTGTKTETGTGTEFVGRKGQEGLSLGDNTRMREII